MKKRKIKLVKLKKEKLHFKIYAGSMIILVFLIFLKFSTNSPENIDLNNGLGLGTLNFSEVLFYLIIAVLLLIIFLVIWMFISEKNKMEDMPETEIKVQGR